MTFRVSALLALLLPTIASAQLRIDPPTLRLGDVLGGPPLRRAVILENTGADPLEVIDIERGCSCLQATLDKTGLCLGEKATLTLDLRTLGHKDGPYLWTVRLHYRIGSRVETAPLRIEANIRNEVVLEPAELRLTVTDPIKHEIILRDRRATPFKITRLATRVKGVHLEARNETPGVFRIALTTDDALPRGERQRGFVEIMTSDPFYGALTLPIEIERIDAAAIHAVPDRIRLRPEAGVRSALLRLRGKDDRLKIERVEAPGLECSWADNPTGGAMLRVRAEKASPTLTSVRVIFADKRELRIPLEWD